MKTLFLTLAAAFLMMFQLPKQETGAGNANHGAYLVENTAMCVQCHSPRDERGNLIRAQLFMGAPVPVRGPDWVQDWALSAPRIAGLPGYSEQDALRLYTQGISRNGTRPSPPMPPFRLSLQDARDVYAFLKSAH